MRHEHLTDRELLILVLEQQEILMASTDALTAKVAELQTVAGEIVAEVNSTDDQAAIDSAVSTIESVVTELKGALPAPPPPAEEPAPAE